jgi:PAS domain S-box-containing protein
MATGNQGSLKDIFFSYCSQSNQQLSCLPEGYKYLPEPITLVNPMNNTKNPHEIHWRGEFPPSLVHFIIDNAGEGIWYLDQNNKILAVNSKGAAIVGYSKEEMIGHSPVEYLTFADSEASGNKVVDKAGVHTLHKVVRKDRSTLLVISRTIPLHKADGSYCGALIYLLDILEMKRWEQQGQKSESLLEEARAERDLLHQIIKKFPDEISIFDRECRYMFVNTARSESAGIRPGEFIGKTPREIELLSSESVHIEDMIRSVFGSGTPVCDEDVYLVEEGEITRYFFAGPISGPDGNIAAVFMISRVTLLYDSGNE